MADMPSRIGNFEVLSQIGSGGMGTVYLGRDPGLGRQVAIKVIREEVRDKEVLDRFFREARAAAALRHPNIITVYTSGQHEYQPYMVMEFVDGESLAEIIRSRRTLPLSDKMSYLEQICAGLHFAHRAGIVHRDIKPANIMIDREGVVRILDFGIARIEGSAMTQDGSLMGSLNYMSPEQMLGRPADHRSDIFSVGSVAYELLCYQQAFKGGLNDGLLHRLPHEAPPALSSLYPGLPPALEQVVMRALEKAPEQRFQDLAEMRSAIVGGQAGPKPEDDRTVRITRPGTPDVPPAGVAEAPAPQSPTPVPAASPTPPPAQPPPTPVSAPASAPPPIPTTSVPPSQKLQLKKEVGGDARAASTIAKQTTPTATRAVAAGTRPQTPKEASSRRWILIGVAATALVIAAAAISQLTGDPPNVLEQERPGIEAAMERFRTAYRNRNLESVAAVFPALPAETEQAMQRAFDDCLVYEVTFADMQVEMNPTDATLAHVDVSSTHVCTPSSGGRQTTTAQHDLFTLGKDGDEWHIDSAVPAPDLSTDGIRASRPAAAWAPGPGRCRPGSWCRRSRHRRRPARSGR